MLSAKGSSKTWFFVNQYIYIYVLLFYRLIVSKRDVKPPRLIQLELEKQSEQGDVSNYQANGEFDLVNFSARRNVEYYSCCPEPYPDITYEIRLRRRPMFYVFNLILPCILINSVGECTSIVFASIVSFHEWRSIMRICNITKLRDDCCTKVEYSLICNRVKRSYRIWRRKFH